MEIKNLKVRFEDSVAIITVSRPKSLNALNHRTMAELEYCFITLLPEKNIKCCILTGAGDKAFVAGADISEFNASTEEIAFDFSQKGQKIFSLIENFTKPVIALVNGYALGGGCELAMACHLRIATRNAMFGQPEINLGIIPGYGGTQRLVRYIGRTKAIEYLLTGNMFDAEEALNLGLINRIVDREDALREAIELARIISEKAPLAIEEILRCVNVQPDYPMDGYLAESKAFGKLMVTEDAKEGARAFLEKRKPNFKGV